MVVVMWEALHMFASLYPFCIHELNKFMYNGIALELWIIPVSKVCARHLLSKC
jgi:hypothetical protein